MKTCIPEIKEDFDKVISHSQNHQNPHTDKILDLWAEAKQHFYKRFGNKLIYEYGIVRFTLSEEERKRRLDEFIDYIWDEIGNDDLARFIEQTSVDFFNKTLSVDFVTDSGIIIPKGTKIVRAFKFFESNAETLACAQDRASMILQEDCVSGILCLSIHPLDFLSASENSYHWRSCHALNGEFRSGNLSYMLDKSTIICYLKSANDKKVKLPNFPDDVPWYSKKWRMWLFEEDDAEALFAGRQYPFFSKDALEIIFQAYLEVIAPYHSRFWASWHSEYVTQFPFDQQRDTDLIDRYVALGGRIYGMSDLVTDAKNAQHFNDLTRSSIYKPYYTWSRLIYPPNKQLHFSLGAEVPCICCGRHPITIDGSMYCSRCGAERGLGDYIECDLCGQLCHIDQSYYVDGEEAGICEDCCDKTIACSCCGMRFYANHVQYDEQNNTYTCISCLRGRRNING
jgi:hypothetical protein